MKVFKIPKVTEGHNAGKNMIVGIIDASGSMSSHWAWVANHWNEYVPHDNALTICFDTKRNICQSNILDTQINKHGGGGTLIIEAFQEFEKHLATISKDTALTVIFISDGQDNNLSTLEKRCNDLKGNTYGHYINFLCLGVQNGFPTFLSMKLREKYHTGDATIPAIFLIEYSSEKAFFNKFESMKPYFTSAKAVEIHPSVIQYPWAEPKSSLFEGVWCVSDSSMVEVQGNIFDISKDSANLEGVVELFKGWVQAIHLESLKPGANTKEMAIKTIKLMEILLDQIKKEKGIDILNPQDSEEKEGMTFHQRALRNLIKHTLSRAAWYYEEIKLLAEGKSPKELSEYDAAKRIGIGTIVGKYHQKALALKGITVDEFKKLRDEFASVHREVTLTPTSSQENSVITLMNQKEVFLQKDFNDALSLCNSQFDLVEAFPMIGLAIRIKRFNGSMLNPWLTQVRFIAKHHKVVDTVSIIKAANNLELKVADGVVESINAVLPLFDKDDEDMRHLLQTRLYHLMMTFNVMQNVDTLYEDAYLALLSNTLLFLLKENDSDWKRDLLNKIDVTTRLVYYEREDFEKYRKGLIADPVQTIIKDEEQKKYGDIDASKAILHLFMLWRDKAIDEKKAMQIFDAIVAYYFYQLCKEKEFQIHTYLKCKAASKSSDQALDTVRANFDKCQTNGDLRRQVYAAFEKVMSKGDQYEYSWDLAELSKVQTKLRVELLEHLGEMILGYAPKKDEYIMNIAKAYLGGGYEGMFKKEYEGKSVSELTGIIGKKLNIDSKKGGVKSHPQVVSAISAMSKEFQTWFEKIHYEIMPISKDELKKYCEEKKVDFNKYVYLEDSGLIKNACLAPGCPHYLKLNDRLHHHLAIWESDMPPAFHRTVKANYKSDAKEIFAKFVKGSNVKSGAGSFEFTNEKYHRSEAEVLEYIAKLKEIYSKILG